jgi:hypothetical protein
MANTNLLIRGFQREQGPTCVLSVCLLFLTVFSLNHANAATTNATVEAKIVSTINLVARNGIVFGDIAASSIPGTVTIDTDGSRTVTGGATVNTSTFGSPAKYEVSGDPNAFFIITLPKSVVTTNASGAKMTIVTFTSTPESTGQINNSGKQDLFIGATMEVKRFQPFGSYRGTMETTIEYN